METCATCRFFFRSLPDPDEPGYILGECRHDPPRAGIDEDDELRGIWPYISSGDWCGQYDAVKSPEEVRELNY